jgi:hypothetical protein
MFKFANKKAVMEDIHPVVSAYVTEEKLMELYEHATAEPHDALVIDGTGSKIVFKKNFNIILIAMRRFPWDKRLVEIQLSECCAR